MKNHSNLDEIDHRLLEILHQDARISMTSLGKHVHLTSQAVKNRLDRLSDLGIVKHYTVNVNCPVYGYKVHAIIHLQAEQHTQNRLIEFLRQSDYHIVHFYQTTGMQAYTIDSFFTDEKELHTFLSKIQKYGSYEIQMVLKEFSLSKEDSDTP